LGNAHQPAYDTGWPYGEIVPSELVHSLEVASGELIRADGL
jgi:hypothetical protein